MGVPGADDVMLNYQSTSFHDALYLRQLLNLKPSPEFALWLETQKIFDSHNRLRQEKGIPALFKPTIDKLGQYHHE
jgi:ethanolamine ammonia-lyase large subunit